MQTGPSVIVVPEPEMSDLNVNKLHAFTDDECNFDFYDETVKCARFYEEWRVDCQINERVFTDSNTSDSEDEAIYIRPKKFRKRVRWRKRGGQSMLFFHLNKNYDRHVHQILKEFVIS